MKNGLRRESPVATSCMGHDADECTRMNLRPMKCFWLPLHALSFRLYIVGAFGFRFRQLSAPGYEHHHYDHD